MGLDERRKLANLVDEVLPSTRQEIKGDTGADIELELDVATFKDDAVALNYFEHQGAKDLANAMRIIGGAAMGKEAIIESIKKARFVNLPADRAADNKAVLADGVLTITGAWSVGSSDGWIGYDALARSIPDQL
ncbi:MAG: hypothetical protein ABIS47_13085 [Acidimicrobiales bacterium]